MKNVMTGREGEKRFSLLCTEAGLTCNKSVEDDFGWDMLIEIPPKAQPLLAIDQRSAQTSISVQIKATKGSGRTVTISLDNALRYTKSPLPTFIVLVVLSKDEGPRYFIKHVWTGLMGAWLLAAREADARGVKATHKERVSVTFEEADDHSSDPLAWIERQIATIAHPYAAAKAVICDTIGFENARGVATITFDGEGPDEFLDLQLGLKPSLRARRFVFTSERFGIQASQPEIDLENVQVFLTPEGTPAIGSFEFSNGRRVSVPATLYSAAAPAADNIVRGMRIQTRCLDLVLSRGDRIQAKATLKMADKVPGNDLRLFANLLATPPQKPIKFELEVGGQTFDLGSMTINEDEDTGGWAHLAFAVEALDGISASVSRPLPEMSVRELNAAAGELAILSALASDRTMYLDFDPDSNAPRTFRWLLAYAVATVGDWRFGAVVRRPITRNARRNKRRQTYFGPGQILYGRWSGTADFDLGAVHSAYERHLERLGVEGHIMALNDFHNLVSRRGRDVILRSDLPAGRQPPRSRKHKRSV